MLVSRRGPCLAFQAYQALGTPSSGKCSGDAVCALGVRSARIHKYYSSLFCFVSHVNSSTGAYPAKYRPWFLLGRSWKARHASGTGNPSRASCCGSLASNIQGSQGACNGTQNTRYTARLTNSCLFASNPFKSIACAVEPSGQRGAKHAYL